MNEKQFRVQEHCLRSSYGIEAENWLVTNDNHCVVLNNKAEAHMVANMFNDVIDVLNELHKENKELKEILKHTYEIHECETCKHNENFNWLDPATMKREYNSKCSKGLYYDDEVHDCEEYELDLEMFKKRVKR